VGPGGSEEARGEPEDGPVGRGEGVAEARTRREVRRELRPNVVLGGGTPYFPSLHNRINLELIEMRTFGSRVVYVRYAVSAPPETAWLQLQRWFTSRVQGSVDAGHGDCDEFGDAILDAMAEVQATQRVRRDDLSRPYLPAQFGREDGNTLERFSATLRPDKRVQPYVSERLGLDTALGSNDRSKLNVNGSSLAAGHPFAATGAPGWPAYDPGRRRTQTFDQVTPVAASPEERSRLLWRNESAGSGPRRSSTSNTARTVRSSSRPCSPGRT